MQYFWGWAVLPLLRDRGVKQVLEIGASQGGNTVRVLRGLAGVRVTVVDPCLDADLVARFKDEPAVTVWGGRSLEVLPFLGGPYDAILIDGDHNYYWPFAGFHGLAEHKGTGNAVSPRFSTPSCRGARAF